MCIVAFFEFVPKNFARVYVCLEYMCGDMCMQYVYVIVFLGEEPVQHVYTCMFV